MLIKSYPPYLYFLSSGIPLYRPGHRLQNLRILFHAV
nr:MAG TPA: hypothetical protein [Caudoviricetes sp.]